MNIKTIIREAINENLLVQWINDEIVKANEFLSDYGLSVAYNAKYNFEANNYYRRCYAIYQNGSVKNNGKIKIGINIALMQATMKESDFPTQIKLSVWHEIAHGIIEYLKGLRRKDTQCGTKIFNGMMLDDFRYIIKNEEESAEDFGYVMADITEYSELYDFLRRYENKIITLRNQEGGSKWLQHFRQNNETNI